MTDARRARDATTPDGMEKVTTAKRRFTTAVADWDTTPAGQQQLRTAIAGTPEGTRGHVALAGRLKTAQQTRAEQERAAKQARLESAPTQPGKAATPAERRPPADGDGDGQSAQMRCAGCGRWVPSDGTAHTCPGRNAPVPAAGIYSDISDRGERTKAMLADLASAMDRIVDSGRLTDYLDAVASNGLGRWSANNRLLAVLQLADRRGLSSTDDLDKLSDMHMMGAKQWRQHDHSIRKGERAIWILAPMTRKIRDRDKDTGEETETVRVTGFSPVAVFDASQTEGPPLPSITTPVRGDVPPGLIRGLTDRVRQAGYEYAEQPIPGTNPERGTGTLGYTQPSTKRVVVDSRLSPAQKASVVAHELGHIHAGHVDEDYSTYRQHRGRMETEAEMAAYLVCRHRGMSAHQTESFSPGYIVGWGGSDPGVMSDAMQKATAAFNTITDGDWPDAD